MISEIVLVHDIGYTESTILEVNIQLCFIVYYENI